MEGADRVSSRGLLEIVHRRWRVVAAVAAVGLQLAVIWTLTSTPNYRSTAGVFFSLEYGNSASDLVQGSTYAQNQVASFAQLATTPAVLGPVIDEFELTETPQTLAPRVRATAPIDTVMVTVTVTDASAEQSALLADAVVDSLSALVEELAPSNGDGRPTVRAVTVAPAEVPTEPASPDALLNVVVGLALGLLAGTAAAFVRDALDTRVRDEVVLTEVTALPAIGTVGLLPRGAHPVVVVSDPHGSQAESFRHLRTNLEFLAVPTQLESTADGARVLMVTSSRPAEGKSTVAANLAAALAETSASVLLVDADLRRPSVARLLDVEGAAGLTTVLLGQAAVADVVQEWGPVGLQVLASGPVPPNPVELLGSPAMADLMQGLRAEYDYVVVDTAPLLPVADAAVLSRLADGVIVVANAGLTRRHQLTESLGNLGRVDAPVLGVVLNAVQRDEESYSYRQRDGEPVSGRAQPADGGGAGFAGVPVAAGVAQGPRGLPAARADGPGRVIGVSAVPSVRKSEQRR